jgi:hypothetical protein
VMLDGRAHFIAEFDAPWHGSACAGVSGGHNRFLLQKPGANAFVRLGQGNLCSSERV